MKRLFDVVRLSCRPSERIVGFYNSAPSRGARYQANIKWVQPAKMAFYHPSRTGDLEQLPDLHSDSIFLPFKHSKELEIADEKVKKIFSLGYQKSKHVLEMYKHELRERVKSHEYETNSREIDIAEITAKIRFFQTIVARMPNKQPSLRRFLNRNIRMRRYLLGALRNEDYKKFEWLLDTLNLEYRSYVPEEHYEITRKKSLELLAKLKVEQFKEERLAELKKKFDNEKVPFLEKKIMKLKQLKEIEEKNNLQPTVTDKTIEDCIKQLEEVKIQVAERAKKGYKRKIHPYFLEAFDEKLLLEKEKAGELIREKLFCRENITVEN